MPVTAAPARYCRAADVPPGLLGESRWRALGRRLLPGAQAVAYVDGYPCSVALYPESATEPLPPPATAARRAAAVVRAPGFAGPSYRNWARVPEGLRSSNQWRRLERRRPRADAVPIARVAAPGGWHPIYDRAATEPTRRAEREREARAAAEIAAPDLSDLIASLPPPRL